MREYRIARSSCIRNKGVFALRLAYVDIATFEIPPTRRYFTNLWSDKERERLSEKKTPHVLLHGHGSPLKSTQSLSRVAGGGSYRLAFML